MASAQTVIAGNLLLDVFVDSTVHSVPESAKGPVHRAFGELESFLVRLGPGRGGESAPGVTIRAGGAAGNVARILAELGHCCVLSGALGDDPLADRYRSLLCDGPHGALVEHRLHVVEGSTTGVTITWYASSGDGRPTCVVSPPPTSPPLFWEGLLSGIAATRLLYLDGYAVPAFLGRHPSMPADRLTESGASLLLDLAHPAVTGARAAELVSLLRQLASAGTEPTVFASAEELAPMGGLDAVARAITGGTLMVVRKEPPTGATVFRLGDGKVEPVARHHGESIEPIETTGLGDAFVAGWIAVLLDGSTSSEECAKRAHEVARLCAAGVGGTIAAMPDDFGV